MLVRFRSDVPLWRRANLLSRVGGTVAKEGKTLGYFKIEVDPGRDVAADAAWLAQQPGVAWAEPNGYYVAIACAPHPQDPFLVDLSDPIPENQWGIYRTGIFDLWRYGGGGDEATRIAIVDTGIDDFSSPHPDLAANVLPQGKDLVDDDAIPTDVGTSAPGYGHGTHVAGVAAASANATGISGVAYCAKILVVRALDCTLGGTCPGTFEDIADGVVWAADAGADVINLSLGGPTPSSLVRDAIQYAMQGGAAVVAASGNDGLTELSYPARFAEVIAVGATDEADHVAAFSNSGPELDVVAPGVGIYSAVPGPAYEPLDGTSMAAPFVSGLAALLLARSPSISPLELEKEIRRNTIPLAGGDGARDGYGRVAFLPLSDVSDAPPPYGEAKHGSFAWEWLGDDASPEQTIGDPLDGDYRFNIGAPNAADGYDDGVFPMSIPTLPILPPHLGGGSSLSALLSVSHAHGPRYGADPSKQLHLDVWSDWDGDRTFESGAAAERIVTDETFDPSTWAGSSEFVSLPISAVDEHLFGNPLVVRSRLTYGASTGSPTGTVPFGEVEDVRLINFVEDFDITMRPHVPGVYTIQDGWAVRPDTGPCAHRASLHFAASDHPGVGAPCNGFIERVNLLVTPDMDWSEYTAAFLRFWYCHDITGACSPEGDRCRVRIDRNGTKIDLGPIPMGSGMLTFDVSDLTGTDVVRFEFVEETDWQGRIAIDDVVIWAYDGDRPDVVSDLSSSRVAGTAAVDASWTAPEENEHIPSPPADGQASAYEIRYARGSVSDWRRAIPVRPQDLASAPPVPGVPGAAEGVSFRVPSALQAYCVGVRTHDEGTNRSFLSNASCDSTGPSFAVHVAGLGDSTGAPLDTVTTAFTISNLGNAPDGYAVTATDARGWSLLDVPGYVALDAGSSGAFALRVLIPSGAQSTDIDTVTVTATSLTDAGVSAAGTSRVLVEGTTVAVAGPAEERQATLKVASANPSRAGLRLRLRLTDERVTTVQVMDVGGRVVRDILAASLPSGDHTIVWDGNVEGSSRAPSGVYFVDVRAGSSHWVERFLLVN